MQVKRKVANKTARFLLVTGLSLATLPVYGQMIDDKIMPPVLVMPEPPAEDSSAADDLPDAAEQDLPLSVIEVPVLDIVSDDEEEQELKPQLVGTFSLLHKVTAKVRQIELLSGQEYAIGDLSLTMHDCISAPPEEPPETKTFLQISEFEAGRDKRLFNGWMFASSPGINALEHAVYDLWPLACKTEDGLAFTGEILPPIDDKGAPVFTR